MRERKITLLTNLSALAIGGIIGAAVALLVAPQSGQETREILRSKTMEMKDKAMEAATDTRERASNGLNDIAQQAKDRISSIKGEQEWQEPS